MRVIIGGTFGYLHKGHRALLAKAFEVGDYVYIGLTTDSYVDRTKPNEGLPRYAEREAVLRGFVSGLGKKFQIAHLDDRFGPLTSGDFYAIVVSPGTMPTALEINRIRARTGLKPLSIISIGYVLAADSMPISTSRIMKGEIDGDGNATGTADGSGAGNT